MKVIGLDIGTTGCKALVVEESGDVSGYGFKELLILKDENGRAEQEPNAVWNTSKEVISEALNKSGRGEIGAICVSVQGDAVIPVDKNINPLHNALLGMDYRSEKQAAMCAELFGDEYLFKQTGMRSHPLNSVTKILWLKENQPQVFNNTYKFMTYADFINAKLGAESFIDCTMASRTMAYDIKKKDWSKEILSKLGVGVERLSDIVQSGEIVGEVRRSVMDELGLSGKTLIVSGGHDQTCAAVGAGAITPDIVLNSHGTAEVLAVTLMRPVLNEGMYASYYPCYSHAAKDRYFTFSLNHIGGVLLKWYRDEFAFPEMSKAKGTPFNAYELIEKELSPDPADLMVLPHFNGSGTPWCDFNSKGAIIGLKLSSTRHDIAKAIFEASAYELRINIETMGRAGISFDEVRCVGGASKSDFWMQLKADITGLRFVTLNNKEAAALGVAILALTALSVYPSVEDAVSNIVKTGKVYEPNSIRSKRYLDRYEIYKKLYPALEMINALL